MSTITKEVKEEKEGNRNEVEIRPTYSTLKTKLMGILQLEQAAATSTGWARTQSLRARNRAVTFIKGVCGSFVLLVAYVNIRVIPMGVRRTCGQANGIELTAAPLTGHWAVSFYYYLSTGIFLLGPAGVACDKKGVVYVRRAVR